MMLTFSAYTMYSSPGLMLPFSASSQRGITIHYPLRGIDHPLQLYTAHSVESTLFEKPSADILLYGDDPEAPTPECDDDGATVTVPEIDLPLSQYSLDVLEVTINPMQECDDYGLQLYMDSVHLVHQLMQDNQLID